MLRRLAALVKLRSSATARNADKTLSSSRTTMYSQSTALADCTGYSRAWSRATLILRMKSLEFGRSGRPLIVEAVELRDRAMDERLAIKTLLQP